MPPSDFWNLTITEFWWWFETIIPEEFVQKTELTEKLRTAQEAHKNGKN